MVVFESKKTQIKKSVISVMSATILYNGQQVTVSQAMVDKCALLSDMYQDCAGQLCLPADDKVSLALISAIDNYASQGIFPDNVDLRLLANLAIYLDYQELVPIVKQRIKAYLQDKPVEYQYWWQTGEIMPMYATATATNATAATDAGNEVANRLTGQKGLYERCREIFVKYYAPVDPNNIIVVDGVKR